MTLAGFYTHQVILFDNALLAVELEEKSDTGK